MTLFIGLVITAIVAWLIVLQYRRQRREKLFRKLLPPEFFAVATETFFEKPVQMKIRLRELYEQLRKYYHLDPADWHSSNKGV
ncbi:MAG TPA: zinc-dependent peptidase [Gammaproteobacteria bacterium]|nr:zinc-dependent peptidase [Gammaproteobacteria bacterium]